MPDASFLDGFGSGKKHLIETLLKCCSVQESSEVIMLASYSLEAGWTARMVATTNRSGWRALCVSAVDFLGPDGRGVVVALTI